MSNISCETAGSLNLIVLSLSPLVLSLPVCFFHRGGIQSDAEPSAPDIFGLGISPWTSRCAESGGPPG
ncbi:hypothetical protein BDW42DRAFT_179692 [Aspergillus taichungensis]|uniref:Uncharacterized protein n=1 Tax=Aspergillus taichungensis TaxID=482145 RepID=A0A2J5HGK8_9EURO|nr:hypothetical protein BDW42DRAFT_179692 [Aspergillus taichungensis]